MKEKLHQYVADSTAAYTVGTTAAAATTNGNHQILILLVTALAPVIKDVAVSLFDKLINKLKKK